MSEKKSTAPVRKKYFDFETQFRPLVILSTVAFVFTAINCFISYNWLLNLRPIFDSASAGPMKPADTFNLVADLLLYRLIGIMILMFFTFVAAGVLVTHRMMGPVAKLRRELRKFFAGQDIGQLHFRTKDEFQDLPPLINKLLDGYKGERNTPYLEE